MSKNTPTVAGDLRALRVLRAHLSNLRGVANWMHRIGAVEQAKTVQTEADRFATLRVAVPVPCTVCYEGDLTIVTVGDPKGTEPTPLDWNVCNRCLPDYLF